MSSGSRIGKTASFDEIAFAEGLVERQRVEDLGLDILRVLATERAHRLLVVSGARVLVDLVVVLVELFQRSQPVALALRLRSDGLTLLDRIEPALQSGRVKWADKRVGSLADGDAPIRDGARRINLGDRIERLHGLRKVERMQHRQCTVELLLGLGCARRLEQHATEVTLGLLRSVVVVREGNRSEGGDQARREKLSAVPHVHLLDNKVEERRVAAGRKPASSAKQLGGHLRRLSEARHPQATSARHGALVSRRALVVSLAASTC